MHTNDPLTGGPAHSAARTFDSTILPPPSQCSQCAEYSLRISDLEACLIVAKRQALMAFDKASKTSNLTKQVSILDDKVSSLTEKNLHHEECNSFLLGIIESACEMLRCKFPFDLSFLSSCSTAIFMISSCPHRHLFRFCC
jgi:hypothetical protein